MKRLHAPLLVTALLLSGGAVVANEAPIASNASTVEIMPAKVSPQCEREVQHRQVLFDLCEDQLALLREAQRRAKSSGKLVLVSFGADWCIWCHVFEAHILGKYGRFSYHTPEGPWAMDEKLKKKNEAKAKDEAAALKVYVADQFVVVNIGQQASDAGLPVLRDTQAEEQFSGGLPFIYALDQNGKFAGAIKSEDVEIRRDGRNPYRGYDRVKLLAALKLLSAQKPTQ